MTFDKKDLFTIPNILTYIRLIAIPFFIWMMIASLVKGDSDPKGYYLFAGFVIFIFAEITDIVDGHIARKYNLITDIGKVLDPTADKLLQCFAILLVAIVKNVWFVWAFMALLLIKEIFMGVSSKYFMRASKRQIEQKSNRLGKNGAVLNFVGVILAFGLNTENFLGLFDFPEILMTILYYVAMVEIIVAMGIQIYAAVNYTKIYYSQLVALRESGVLDTLDRYGNPLNKDESNS